MFCVIDFENTLSAFLATFCGQNVILRVARALRVFDACGYALSNFGVLKPFPGPFASLFDDNSEYNPVLGYSYRLRFLKFVRDRTSELLVAFRG